MEAGAGYDHHVVADDDPWFWPVRIFGAFAALMVPVTVVIIFVLAKNIPASPSSSYSDGMRNAPSISIPRNAPIAEIQAACASYFSRGLSSNDGTAVRGPFIQGCVQGVKDAQHGS